MPERARRKAAAVPSTGRVRRQGRADEPSAPRNEIVELARSEATRLHPTHVVELERVAGNDAVAASLALRTSGRAAPIIVQRHNMPMPRALEPPRIAGAKKPWTVSSILSAAEDASLRQQLMRLIPPEAKPSPDERVSPDRLKFTDCPPGKMPSGYENAAAKVEASGGIFFNNMLDDYFNEDGSPNVDKIKTTVVHEAMHAVSANHTGLQGYADLMSPTKGDMTIPQLQPDEAITDYLSVQVYEAVFGSGSAYVTAYWVPASSKVAAAADSAQKTLAQNQQLPVMWTGRMVEILQDVLGVDEQKLKQMYFGDPGQFGALIAGHENEIRARWNRLMGAETLSQHRVLSTDFKETVLEEVVEERIGRLHTQREESKRIAIVKSGLEARGVPATIAPSSGTSVFSEPVIKRKIAEVLERHARRLPAELKGLTAVTEDVVERLIAMNDEAALEMLERSDLFPLASWTAAAWARYRHWAGAR